MIIESQVTGKYILYLQDPAAGTAIGAANRRQIVFTASGQQAELPDRFADVSDFKTAESSGKITVISFKTDDLSPIFGGETLPPSGPAGGDLGGSYPIPVVLQVGGLKVKPTEYGKINNNECDGGAADGIDLVNVDETNVSMNIVNGHSGGGAEGIREAADCDQNLYVGNHLRTNTSPGGTNRLSGLNKT